MRKEKLKTRFAYYIIGLLIMTAGIAISVKSDLGVSPISAVPYTITCVSGMEMGKATIVFHCILVLFQILLLRRKFQIKNLLQIVVGIVFGYFTTFCNWCVGFLPDPHNIVLRLVMMLISIVLLAIGIFFYLPADIMPIAGEGCMQALSDVTKVDFAKVKVAFDVAMVVISLVTCLIVLRSLGSVGIGTVLAAFLVGITLGILNDRFGDWRDELLAVEKHD